MLDFVYYFCTTKNISISRTCNDVIYQDFNLIKLCEFLKLLKILQAKCTEIATALSYSFR